MTTTVPLLLSRRAAARLLGIDHGTVPKLVAAGVLRDVPVGTRRRIPLAEVERLAREGWTLTPTGRPRRTTGPKPGRVDPEALRRLKVEDL